MKKYLVSIFLIACSIPSLASDRLQDLSHAIARAEGFYTRRTIPDRLHNPGDLRTVRGYRYLGQIGTSRRGYAIFRNDNAGFAALTHQLEKIVAGSSAKYTVDMTLAEFGRKYAESGVWARTVSRILGVTPDTYLFEVLDVPPVLTLPLTSEFVSGII